jgi:hypothetical protein
VTKYSLWMQGGSYPALEDRMLIGAALGGGGVLPAASFAGMTPSVLPSSMTVQITAGRCVCPVSATDPGAYLCVCDAPEHIDSPMAPGAGTNRIDLYIIRPRDPAVNGSYTQNDWILDVVPGTPGASPVVPATPAGTAAVASALIIGGQAAITPANLTDLRVLSGGAGPRGTLAFVRMSSNSAGTTTSVDWITAPPISVDGTRRLEIIYNGQLNAGTVNDKGTLRLYEGSTMLQMATHTFTAAGSAGRETVGGLFVTVPTAGSHTYKVVVNLNGGTGPMTGIADPTYPAQLLIKDIGT